MPAFVSREVERRCLQAVIALGGFVPVGAGLTGALLGGAVAGSNLPNVDLDSQMRFLSGVLLAVGLAYWEAIPQIERRGRRMRLLTAIVVLGGLMRLIGILGVALPDAPMLTGLAMEVVVAPLICLWQGRIARRYAILD